MKKKGISFDSGVVEIELDGKKENMNTSREDFGTILIRKQTFPGGKYVWEKKNSE